VSRAFVKEDDDRPERPLPRNAGSQRPNYVTPNGLAQLHAALEAALAADNDRDAEYLRARISSATLVDATSRDAKAVGFGATVTLRQPDGSRTVLHIVGEDEADPATGTISWTSPYAEALEGHRKGDNVGIRRPAGVVVVTVEKISYD
jgi:transcription elongation GreA/GreB family factor